MRDMKPIIVDANTNTPNNPVEEYHSGSSHPLDKKDSLKKKGKNTIKPKPNNPTSANI